MFADVSFLSQAGPILSFSAFLVTWPVSAWLRGWPDTTWKGREGESVIFHGLRCWRFVHACLRPTRRSWADQHHHGCQEWARYPLETTQSSWRDWRGCWWRENEWQRKKLNKRKCCVRGIKSLAGKKKQALLLLCVNFNPKCSCILCFTSTNKRDFLFTLTIRPRLCV